MAFMKLIPLALSMMSLCFCNGCRTDREEGARLLPRTGELFVSTRSSIEENNGEPYVLLGCCWAPTVIAPVVLFPTGLTVGVLDQFVFSPAWDVLCIPRDLDLSLDGCRGQVVDWDGNPLDGVEVKPSRGRLRETDAHGCFFVPVSTEKYGNYQITFRKPGYDSCSAEAARNLQIRMRKAGR